MTAPKRPDTYRSTTIASGIRTAAQRTPDKIAIREGVRSLTYRELLDRIDRVSVGAVHDLKLERGDRVMLLALNCLEYIEVVAGFSAMGAAVATINTRQSATEIDAICQDCRPRVVVVDQASEELARSATLDGVERVLVMGSSYDEWIAKAQPAEPVDTPEEWEAFAISYTSGTTGKPKGIVLSHRSRVLSCFGMAAEYGCYGPDDSQLSFAPLFHGGGFVFALASVFFGGTCELLPRFDPEEIMRKLHEGGFTGTFMVPTHFHAILNLDEKTLTRYREHTLKGLVCNAAALPQVTKERIIPLFGDGVLHETYGSTEAGIVTNLRPADQLRKKSCVGLPFVGNRLRLVDNDGAEVAQGEVGELYSTSPYLFNGYWDKPAETAATMRDGWVTAGDMARRDEEGYLHIVDRKKDMIISGGVNVYPREVEDVLSRHPAIREVAVVGVPDDYWGERIKAFIVPQAAGAPSSDEVIAFGKESLAAFKVPKEVDFIDALPRNPAGKILKRALREQSA
jgi:long-chain acyl-CoA synthetase